MKFNFIIPSHICLTCDICCRFPERDSPLAPIFLPNETTAHIKAHLTNSYRVRLREWQDIYLCQFFDIRTNRCTIYQKRPFDCQIYPFVIMFDRDNKKILLGVDKKCPFVRDAKNYFIIKRYSDRLIKFLEDRKNVKPLLQNPSFIGNFQEEVIPLSTLILFTKFIVNNPEIYGFKRLSLEDKPVFDALLKEKDNVHSGESFVSLYLWKDINPIWWKKTENNIRVLIETDSDYIDFTSVKRFPDYIYLTKDLVELKGKKYRHKRASCNYFEKHYRFKYLPYKNEMKTGCLRLLSRWAKDRRKRFKDPYYCRLLRDSFNAHKTAMEDYRQLGLIGRVIKIKNKICGYTFGFELTGDTFCILFEITDIRYKGISEYIFREFCREMVSYTYINTMDDSGLENLRISKLSYHPQQMWSKSHHLQISPSLSGSF